MRVRVGGLGCFVWSTAIFARPTWILRTPRGVAGLRRQRGPLGSQPAVDASPRQPRDRIRRVQPRRDGGKRARRDLGAGSRRQLLEWPVRLPSLPEPFPPAPPPRHPHRPPPPAPQF